MRSRLRLRLLLPLFALSAALPAAVLAGRAWQVSLSPSTATAGVETNIRLTVTNTGDNGGGSEITCVRVQVPASFQITDVRVVSVYGQTAGAAYAAWSFVWTGGQTVAFKDADDHHPLIGSTPPQDEAVFRITGKASSPGSSTWTVTGADHPGNPDTTTCGSGSLPTKSLTVTAVPAATPTPTPTPTPKPTPTPTPKPTPTPTPVATPTPTPTPTATTLPTRPPTPTPPATATPPAPTAGPTAPPTPGPGSTTTPLATPTGSSPAPDPASPGPSQDPPPGSTVDPSAAPSPAPAASHQATGGDDPGAGFEVGGFILAGANASGGRGTPRTDGLDAAALSVLEELPGGLIAFAGPAVVLGVPGVLVLIAVAAQALGALAWLPVARRKLGAFGIRGPRA